MVAIKFPEKVVKFQFPTAFKVGKLVLEDESLVEYFTALYDTELKKKQLEDRIKSIKNRL